MSIIKTTSKPMIVVFATAVIVSFMASNAFALTATEELGKNLFFDTNLSTPVGQACASCHSPSAGFADPDRSWPVSKGAVSGYFGNRNSPTSAYAEFNPPFTIDAAGKAKGGLFWDGRASSLIEQAKGPFLNPLEMHNLDEVSVVDKVKQSSYASLFKSVYGDSAFDNPIVAYDKIAQAIAVYESSSEMNPFTSKFDYYLKDPKKYPLTSMELNGLNVFRGKGKCETCHPSKPGSGGQSPLFTNFTYVNIGAPKNWSSPFLSLPSNLNPAGMNYIDLGLGGRLNDSRNYGKFKVPTLRNVAKTAPYGHNGYFKTLAPMMGGGGMGGMSADNTNSIIYFYNKRDVDPVIPAPEVNNNVNKTDLGNLGLTMQEMMCISHFLNTLTDGYVPGSGGGGCGGGCGGMR